MENILGGIVPAKSNKLTGIGKNATSIGDMGGSLARIHAKMQLPAEISAQQVIAQQQELGFVDGEMELAKLIVAHQEKLLNKAVDLHDMNTQWANITMKADQRLREIQAGHQQSVARYQLGAASTQAYTDGYTEAYQMSAKIFE